MTQQETKAVEEAAKTKTNEYCVSSDEVLSLKRSVIHDYLLSLFIAGAQFLDELRKPSEPETNVVEVREELVKRIEEILNKRDGNIEGHKALSWLAYKSVATEIVALMQPDNELLEALKLAKTFLHRNELSTPQWKMINVAISKYEKQSK